MIKDITYIEELGMLYLEELKELLAKDTYISKNKYNKILDKYDDLFKNIKEENKLFDKIKEITNKIDSIVNHHNEIFIQNKLIEYKEYFDHIFDNIDPNIKLDDEQRKAILIDEDYSLVIAGAGSGKTTTMSAKVKYLVEKLKINPNRIIVTSFTRKSTEELNERIKKQFKLDANVTTFHSLGYSMLRKKFSKPIKIITDSQKYNIIKNYIVENLFSNKQLLKKVNEIFCNYLLFDEKILSYKTYDEYYNYYIKKKYQEVKKKLKEYNEQRIKEKKKNLISINGEILKSKEEVEIANFLYRNNVQYKYEKPYPHQIEDNKTYLPDFTVQNNFKTYYIEYYGISQYRKDGYFSIDDVKYYNELIDRKSKIHKKYSTDLIEIFGHEKSIYKLNKELKRRSFIYNEKSEKEIFLRLMETSKTSLFHNFIELIIKFISRFKDRNYTINDISHLIKNTENIEIKKQLEIMKIIMEYYDNYMHTRNMIDFEDMINYAYMDMEEYTKADGFTKYDYIIVDEYQDVSTQKYNFIKKIADVFGAKIIGVGDDWQAIFGFSGADISLFTKFCDMMGYGEIIKITNTYRNSQELIDTAGEFVCKNTTQYQKKLYSNKRLNKPIEIIYYNIKNKLKKIEAINHIILNIYKNNPKSKILLIGRYNNDVDELIESKYFSIKSHNKIICLEQNKADLTFLTAHSSKGLGFDEVIIINAIDSISGFPNKREDDPIFEVFKNKNYDEKILYPEERRLFYVALTRTKNKVYIICPIEKQSEFIVEIKQNKNVKEKFYTS